MKIAYIGTYPPRECGIGTFTNNLIRAVGANTSHKRVQDHATVLAINDPGEEYDYPEEVKFVIRQEHQRDYVDAAKFINFSDADLCILEHEYGIFGGESGVYILPLINRLEVPLLVTFHTVLKEPSFIQRSIVQQIGEKASNVIVMSHRAVRYLSDLYQIKRKKIALIEHGVPSFDTLPQEQVKKKFNFQDRKVLFTFGLLSRNKGIETVINALPPVVERHPDLLYIVLGNTHPSVLKHEGEEYRNYLIRLAKHQKLENNVFFSKQFIDEETLFEYLTAADIYITPYLNEQQITSGTLAYAIGAGVAVVSTPYWHAQELLAENRGRLFDFNDSGQLSDILVEILKNPKLLKELRENAFRYGKNLRWPVIGGQYLKVAKQALKDHVKPLADKFVIDPQVLPHFNLDHIKRITDDTGIIQHAKFDIPNLKEGYCLDDNSRALIMSLMTFRRNRDPLAYNLLPVYLSYIHYMQNVKGTFRNFLSFSRQFLDEEGSEDSFGRTIWALGYLIQHAPSDSYYEFSKTIFLKAAPNFENLEHLKAAANTLIGICYYLRRHKGEEHMTSVMKRLTSRLKEAYLSHSDDEWKWFEDQMSYDNGILPLALFHAAEVGDDREALEIAIKSTEFLESVTFRNGYQSPVGNMGWYRKGGECPLFDQQAIDVMAVVLLYFQAYKTTNDNSYNEKMFISYMWFLGENELGLPVYDHETGGCCDGLSPTGVNRNQGAESTLAYLISHLTILNALEYESRMNK